MLLIRRASASLACAALLLLTGVEHAAAASLSVVSAWARATAPGASVGAAYFEIDNRGAADTLLSISSPVASRVEVHSMAVVRGLMEMRAAGVLAIPAQGRLLLQPGGLHAMLFDLAQPLQPGMHVPLRLVFAHAGVLQVDAVVRNLGDAASGEPSREPSREPGHPPVPVDFRLAAWPGGAASPHFELVDFDGRRRTLDDYRGKTVLVFFGFVHCPDVCPSELFKLGQVMKQLGAEAAQVQLLFITLDPARDTREVLKKYVTAFDSRFVGLTGSDAAIDAAAGSFSVEYARVAGGAGYTIDHSSATFIFDSGGRLRLVGAPDSKTADLLHDVRALNAAAR